MDWFFPAAFAFAGGIVIELINYLVTKAALKGRGSLYVLPLRTLLTAAYIAALYFIGEKASFGIRPPMIGGALGCTLGIIIFSLLLARANNGGAGEERDNG